MAKVVRKPGKGAEVLRVMLANLDDKVGKVGFFETAKYKDGTPVAYVATIQEYGYPAGGIPPRPFFRPTVAREMKNWKALVTSGARAIAKGNSSTTVVMEALTQTAAANVVESIASVTSPPLKASTIKARQRKRADGQTVGNLNKPLNDSGVMINSVTSVGEDV